jgi:hypothetical protein
MLAVLGSGVAVEATHLAGLMGFAFHVPMLGLSAEVRELGLSFLPGEIRVHRRHLPRSNGG